MMTENLTILLVESNSTDAQGVLKILEEVEDCDFQLLRFSKIDEACRFLLTKSDLASCALILLVLPLPELQRIDPLDRLLQVSSDIPIVVISDLKEEILTIANSKNSVQDYLGKNQIEGKLLVHSIRYAIERQKMQQQLDAAKASLQKLAERNEQLEQENTLLSSIINSMQEGNCIVQPDGKILPTNPVEEQIWSQESESTIKSLYDLKSTALLLLDDNGIFDANSNALKMFGCSQTDQLCQKKKFSEDRETTDTNNMEKIKMLFPCSSCLSNSSFPAQPRTTSYCAIGFSPPVQPNGQDSVMLANKYIATAIAEKSCHFYWMYRKSNGEDFPAEVTLTLVEVENRKVLQAAICEIRYRQTTETQLIEAKEAAEDGSRAKSEFLATMSHELRTPLNAILGLSGLIRQEIFGPLNEKQKEYITCIQSSGEHLLALINDLLDLSKVEAGKEQLTFVPLNIQELCTYCLAMVREQAYEQGLKLNLQIDTQAEICIVDERRCKQMLLNLLSNAVKFTLVGEVSLIVHKLPQGIAFIVEDTGIGIAGEKIPLLFEPFRQLDSGLNRQFPGTGLGLALTRSLAKLHGGDVTVESELGKGSKFTLYLPDLPSEKLLLSTLSEDSRNSKGLSCSLTKRSRILLVEHDERSAMLLKDYLEVIGHKVEHLTNTTDFLNSVRFYKPDLILMDVNLRENCTEFELLAALRRESDTKQIRVVMVTAMAMSGDRKRCLEAGADDYLSKPITIAQLEAILMRHL